MANYDSVFSVDNGSTYDELHFKNVASQIFFNNGSNAEDNLREIISGGENELGRWIRFSDGTQICSMEVSQYWHVVQEWDSGYSATINAKYFPVAFTGERPTILVTPIGTNVHFMVMLVRNVSTTYAGDVDVWSSKEYSSKDQQFINLIAIGRWK